jgi:peptidoglycan/xylan/chitin deacetylase (PgdA/CDA1 family)
MACLAILFSTNCTARPALLSIAGAQAIAPATATPTAIALPVTGADDATLVPDVPTSTPTSEPTMTATPLPSPTATATPEASPTPIATFDPLRSTPPTLMLHRQSTSFDPVPFTRDFVAILKEKDFHVVTYEYINAHPEITATEKGRLFILTIDDVNLEGEIDKSMAGIIAAIEDAGYPAVLGVITQGLAANENTVARLKELQAKGWEIAMHGDTHTDLSDLEKVSNDGVKNELRACADKIEQATGVRPTTLILPYGSMIAGLETLRRAGIHFVAGIGGGKVFRTTNVVYFVGREGPTKDAQFTFKILQERFNPTSEVN